jgi:hypothetical protein
MTYQSSNAFRRALEDRLLAQSTHGSVALSRLRKMVAFDRLLARLLPVQPGVWMLKGGLALQLRLGDSARTTKDMDILLTISRIEVHKAVEQAASHDLNDWFTFAVRSDAGALPGPDEGGLRFSVTARVDLGFRVNR